jgi:disulfide bond formation protein DsbB
MAVIGTLYRQFHFWLNLERLALVVLGVGVFTLITALFFEHVGGYQPCELCLKERVIYYLSAPAGLIAYLLASRRPALAMPLLALCGVGYLANTVLAAYHAGVEWRFWAGPSSCTGLGDVATSVNDLLGKIKTERPVPCDVAQFRFAGISFAGYDALLSLGMAAFIFVAIALRFNHRRITLSPGKSIT